MKKKLTAALCLLLAAALCVVSLGSIRPRTPAAGGAALTAQ